MSPTGYIVLNRGIRRGVPPGRLPQPVNQRWVAGVCLPLPRGDPDPHLTITPEMRSMRESSCWHHRRSRRGRPHSRREDVDSPQRQRRPLPRGPALASVVGVADGEEVEGGGLRSHPRPVTRARASISLLIRGTAINASDSLLQARTRLSAERSSQRDRLAHFSIAGSQSRSSELVRCRLQEVDLPMPQGQISRTQRAQF